jgi:transcription elongation factor Elf1
MLQWSSGTGGKVDLELEKKFKCPYCGARISMLLDLSEDGSQEYIEDCEVCCQPIQVSFEAQGGQLTSFASQSIQ